MRGMVLVWVAAIAVIATGCGRERSERFPGLGMGMDGGGASMADGAPAADGSSARDGAGPMAGDGGGVDAGGGPGVDAGPGGTQGTCDPSCLAMSGAFCCTECACGGTSGACEPQCDAPYIWDCEIRCCFDYDTFECACPSGTSWNGECCADSGGTCVVPSP